MHLNYRPEIDGLRALAVLGPVIYHMANVFSMPAWLEGAFGGGFLGVDVFFVISGYLISGIVLRELDKGSFSIANFYARRLRRIAPALFVVVFASIPFALLLMDAGELKDFGTSLIGISVFASNYTFFKETGYFAGPTEYLPMLHTWSLAVEEQFYLFFPPLLLLVWKRSRRAIWPMLWGLFFSSLLFAHYGSGRWPDAGFFLLHTRVWELMAGAILAYAELKCHERGSPRSENPFLALLGVALIGISYTVFDKNTPHPSFYTLPTVLGVMLIIWYGSAKGISGKLLANKPTVGVGLISYSFYLWHVPILAFLSLYYLGATPPMPWLWLGVMVVLSFATWRFIEQPCRNRIAVPLRPLIGVSAALWLVVLGAGVYFKKANGLPERLNYTPALEASFARTAFFYDGKKCVDARTEGDLPELCQIGIITPEPEVDFLLLGDSHAFSFISAFDHVAKQFGVAGATATGSGCPSFIGPVSSLRKKGLDPYCANLNAQVLNYVLAHKPKAVFMAARWRYYTTGQAFLVNTEEGFVAKNKKQRQELIIKELTKTLDFYNHHGIQVYIIGQVPEQPFMPRRTYASLHLPLAQKRTAEQALGYIQNMSANRDDHEEMLGYFDTLFKQWAAEGKIIYLDPTSAFCDATKCPVGTAERSFYFDDDHLSIVGTEKLSPLLEGVFKDLAAD